MTPLKHLPRRLRESAEADKLTSIEQYVVEQRELVQRIKDGISDYVLEQELADLAIIEAVLDQHHEYGGVDDLCDKLFCDPIPPPSYPFCNRIWPQTNEQSEGTNV